MEWHQLGYLLCHLGQRETSQGENYTQTSYLCTTTDCFVDASFAFQSVAKRWPTIITSAIDGLYQASHALSYSSNQTAAESKVQEAKILIERLSKLKHDMGRDRPLEVIGEDGGDSTVEYDDVVISNDWTWFTAPCR